MGSHYSPVLLQHSTAQSEECTITSSIKNIISIMDMNDERKIVFVTKMEQDRLHNTHQAMTDGVGSELGRVMGVQHLHNIGAVNADRIDADV
jgi:hypothetical protein